MCKSSHHWTSSGEPHALRRKMILQAHGDEVRALVGNNPWTAAPIALAVVLQTAAALAVGLYGLPWWAVVALAWAVGSVGAGNLMAAHHEISHYLVFKSLTANRALSIIANCPLAAPLGSLFKQYHVDHHSEMGVNGMDTGIWTSHEAWWVHSPNWAVKLFFLIIFPIPFFFRPFYMRIQKKLDITDLLSWVVVPLYDAALCYCGGSSLKPLAFMLLSTYNGVGLHPIAGHVISEHVALGGDGQETHSCYDRYLNPLLYNFGYHVEHHDFPNIPWNRLPKLRHIAPEYYAHLTSYTSWTAVMWRFITDPSICITGVMTKRVARTGGAAVPASGRGKAAPAATPASAMPLLRGITSSSIH